MKLSTNSLVREEKNSYLSQGWDVAKKYLKTAAGCIPAITAIAIPILLSTALSMAAGSSPYEESNSELALATPQSTAVGFFADAAIGTLQMTFLLGGVLGAAAHVHRQASVVPPIEIEENLAVPSISPAPKLKGNFIHIPQRHWVTGIKIKPKSIERIWQSQMRVLDKLLLYPDAAIFQEGWTKKSHDVVFSIRQKVQKEFSQGIPKDPESWSQSQKRLFAKYGAARTLYYLGMISEIYPTLTSEMAKEMKKQGDAERIRKAPHCDKERVDRVFVQRERALMHELEDFLSKPENQGRQILIVYGARHNFTKYFEAGSFERLTNEPPSKPCPQNEIL